MLGKAVERAMDRLDARVSPEHFERTVGTAAVDNDDPLRPAKRRQGASNVPDLIVRD
jgi:hypothetical protein